MSSPILQAGGQPSRAPRYVPIFTNRFFTGLWTQRNPMRDAATPYLYEKFYAGARFESFIAGSNMEISNKLTLQRRPGNVVYNSATFPTINSFYSFRQFTSSSETIAVIADTANTIYDATGPSTQTTIFTKSSGAGQSFFQSIANVLYFGDGVDQQKYFSDGSGFLTQNWGISIGASASAVTKRTGNGVNGVGGTAWTNPNNVTSTVSFATVALTSTSLLNAQSNTLPCTQFGFGFGATQSVTGVQVTFEAKLDAAPSGGATATFNVLLMKNGNIVGTGKTFNLTNTAVQTFTLGGTQDLWGTSWTSNDVNQTTWGVRLQAVLTKPAQTVTFSARNVQAIVSVVGGPVVAVNAAAGTLSAVNGGYIYVYAYGNSSIAPAVLSSQTPNSNRTGNFTNKLGVDVPLTASTDPQVNQIRVFRTTDNGAVPLEIPTSPYPNTTQTITDSAPDSQLNIFSQAPGLVTNNPPPAGLINCTYHLGRVWGSVANTVYCSAGPDIINGNPNEAFPPANNFVFPSKVIRLWPNGTSGMLVFTVSDVYVILGTTLLSFFAVPFLATIGLLSYNAFDVNGSVIYMMTNDGHVISLDPNSGVSEIGFPIGDQFDTTYNPSTAYVAWHVSGSRDKALYVADGATGWFRMNPVSAPESGLTWSPFATITGGVQAVQSCETSPGVRKLLLGPTTSGQILMRDLGTFSDAGTSYPCSATIGNIVLAQPGDLAEISFITTECVATGSHPTLGVMLDEIGPPGTFSSLSNFGPDPAMLPASLSLYADRFYMAQAANSSALCRHLQLKVSFPTEAFKNELLTYTIFGRHWNER